MSRIDDLIANYQRRVNLPWQASLAPAQRVWIAVYAPEDERRLRLHLPEFGNATTGAGYKWFVIDITDEFENWMASHEYRGEYFANPKLIQPELAGFFERLVEQVRHKLAAHDGERTIVGLVGGGNLFGLGDHVKVSALVERVQDLVTGRILVFFPGELEGNNYRLLGARDGWNYLATPITADKGSLL